MRPGLLLASVSACGALAVASPAWADSLAPALVRILTSPGNAHPLADVTGRIPLSVTLPLGADAAALGLLQVAPGVGAIRLAPGEIAPFVAAHPGLALGVAPPFHPLLDVSGTWTHVPEFRAATGFYGAGVIVGIVDTGLDVRHPDFRTADGHTRVAWMLAAGSPAGLHPAEEAAFGCTDPQQTACAVYAAADIDAMIQSGTTTLTDPDGHGTHVSSIAAGNGGPSVTVTPRYIGLAPEATLIVAAPTQSGGFVDTDILNAARFVFDRAEAVGGPVVVNISLGSDYGPHDGTSALETGLSAMVGDDQPGRAIVVAAGNSGEVIVPASGGPPQGIHTEAHVADGELVRVPIVASAANSGQGYVWVTFGPGSDLEVGLEGPGRATWVGLTGSGSQGSYQSGSGMSALQGGVINNLPSADAKLAGTSSAVVVFTGHWADQSEFAVLLRGTGDASLWITAQGDAAQGLFFEKALAQGTINVPASAPGLLAVGCTVNRIEWTPLGGHPLTLGAFGGDSDPKADSACYFSSRGPTPAGVQKPDLSAPGAFVGGAMSADADPRTAAPGGLFDLPGCPAGESFCAVLDDYHALASGTSMSAPHAAGAVALLMEVDPSLTQARVTEVLQAGARLSHGHVPDPDQLGPGSLDVEGARLALLDTMSGPTVPDPALSWYTLSSGYARPDPTWPVWGTVELRKSDGSIAGGVDGSSLTLSLRGGVVVQPLTQVRPGLWRFAVAGRPVDLASVITVDVAYAGVPLGAARTLPVGYDAWSAADPSLGAAGSAFTCALPPGQPGPGLPARSVAIAALALLVGLKRRSPSGSRPTPPGSPWRDG